MILYCFLTRNTTKCCTVYKSLKTKKSSRLIFDKIKYKWFSILTLEYNESVSYFHFVGHLLEQGT